MKACVLVLAILAVLITAAPVEETQEDPRFVELPDDGGNMRLVDLEEEYLDQELLSEVARNPANNRYFLFTRRNPIASQELVFNNPQTVSSSNFNPGVPTIVVVHGWISNQNSDLNPVIRDAYLGRSDVNVIVMDWRRLALSNYYTSARGVPAVGRGLGEFLEWVNRITGAPFNRMHLVGFSLGGHLVGNAGRYLRGQVARITGLDPAGPLWQYNSDRLNSNDAVYVEAIHTNGALGIGKSVANADFFANGGNGQPGCYYYAVCEHNRAWEFFAATVKYNHLVGFQCDSYLQATLNGCSGSQLQMGNDDLNKRGTGIYRANTGRRYPF